MMDMEWSAIIGLGVVAVCLVVLLRQYKPEYALMISLICSVLIFSAVIARLLPALDEISGMLADADIDSSYIAILLKAMGLCFVTQIASDSCRDAGESAIASRIDLAGRIALVLVALPLFRDIITIALGFMSM